MNEISRIGKILDTLKVELPRRGYSIPIVDAIGHGEKNRAFKILIAAMLSTRTRDTSTAIAVERLFSEADNPLDMYRLGSKNIEKLIHSVGFYKTKSKNILAICEILLREYKGNVPNTMGELLRLPGVGRKVANLVLSVAFGKDAICVDTHVHRIMNRVGFIKTKSPLETEMKLREKLPKKYWRSVNNLLVCLGQNVCKPIKPLCTICPIRTLCKQVGVKSKG